MRKEPKSAYLTVVWAFLMTRSVQTNIKLNEWTWIGLQMDVLVATLTEGGDNR